MAELHLEIDSMPGLFSVRTFSLTQTLSKPFEARIHVRSPNPDVDLEELVGRGAIFAIRRGLPVPVPGLGETLVVHGVCGYAQLVHAEPTGLSTYVLGVTPKLHFLRERRNTRVFQHQNTLGIVRTIFEEWGIEHETSVDESRHPSFEYRVQYDEDDLSFVGRLLEAAGISYFFDHHAGSKLVLCDRPEGRDVRAVLPYLDKPGGPGHVPHLSALQLRHTVAPNRFRLRDHDFRRREPVEHLDEAERATPPMESYQFAPGATLTEKQQTSDTPVGDDQGCTRVDVEHGDTLAKMAVERTRSAQHVVTFATSSLDVWPGNVVATAGHPHRELNGTFLVTDASVNGDHDGEWVVSGRAALGNRPYRPGLTIPRPLVTSVETAMVVGPSGEEIYTDELGRIRAQFHWDREGRSDERSSCWLRVSQGWAGAGFGMMAIPRVGQEVLVAFVGGNPDQPVVIGRVHNVTNPVPHRLPEKKTISTWRSATTPGGEGFNELSFDDKQGEELVYVHAERDMERHVEVDERERVGHDRTVQIDRNLTQNVRGKQRERTGGDRTILADADMHRRVVGHDQQLVAGKQRVTVGGDRHDVTKGSAKTLVEGAGHVHVKGEQRTRVDGKVSGRLGNDLHLKMAGRCVVTSQKEIGVNANVNVVIEAGQRLSLIGPGGFIDIGPDGISIVGTVVRINSGGTAATAPALDVETAEDAEEAEVGETEQGSS